MNENMKTPELDNDMTSGVCETLAPGPNRPSQQSQSCPNNWSFFQDLPMKRRRVYQHSHSGNITFHATQLEGMKSTLWLSTADVKTEEIPLRTKFTLLQAPS